MKYQQVSVDFVNMVFTAFSYLALAGAAWIFLRLLQACFYLPRHLKKQNDMQHMLQEKVDSYERYLLECEQKERNGESNEAPECGEKASEVKIDNRTNEETWKERRECLEMLKRELKRVQDGGDIYDWDYLLEEDDKMEDENTKETKEAMDSKKEETSLKEVECETSQNAPEEVQTTEEKKDK